MKVLIVIPAYNEERSLALVIENCKKAGIQDILVVDDGSHDCTAEVAQTLGVWIVRHIINRGAGAATQTGLDTARKMGFDTVVTIDADEQHDPSDIAKLLEAMRETQADIVIGSRFENKKNSIPFLRIVFNKIGNVVTYLLSGVWVTDSQSGFKVFGKNALEKIHITANGFEFCSEIFQEINLHRLKVTTCPINVLYSENSMKKGQNFSTGITTVVKLLIRSLMR